MIIKKEPFSINLKVRLLFIASGFFRVAIGMQLPLLYIFVLSLGGDLRHLGIVFGIYGAIYAFSVFIISVYLLQYRHFIYSISFILWSLYAVLMYNAHSAHHIYSLQFLAGFSSALGYLGFTQILVLNTLKHEYTEIRELYSLLGSVIGALAAAIGGILGYYYSVRPLFLVMCVFCLLAFVVSLYLLKIQDM